MKTVKISRKRWTRGESSRHNPALRNDTGQSCCLGFVARAYGLKTWTGASSFPDLANGRQLPLANPSYHREPQDCSVLPKKIRPRKRGGVWVGTKLHNALVSANDSGNISPKDRERMIRDLLAEAGIRVVFTD